MGSSPIIKLSKVSLASLLLRHAGEGQLLALYGHPSVHAVALQILAWPLFHDYGVMVLDAGNHFDPYLISRMVQTLRRDPRKFLSKILISRSFTCYQTHALVQKVCTTPTGKISRMVLVLGCLRTFYDEDVSFVERRALLRKTLALLQEISQRGITVLVTSADPPLNVRGKFTNLLVSVSDRAARLSIDQDGSLGIDLVKGIIESGISRR